MNRTRSIVLVVFAAAALVVGMLCYYYLTPADVRQSRTYSHDTTSGVTATRHIVGDELSESGIANRSATTSTARERSSGPPLAQTRPQDAARVLMQYAEKTAKPYEEPYTLQSRAIQIETGLFGAEAGIGPKSMLVLRLFPNCTYTVEVTSVGRDINNVLSLSGRIQGEPLQTFVLSSHDGVVLADLQDLNNNRLFKIKYVAPQQQHYVLEYDVKNMPPRYDGTVGGLR